MCVCVCFWYLPWKLLLFVRKCRRYCGSPFLFTTQELMVRGAGTQQDTQLDGLWRRRELNCVDQTFCRTWMNLKGHLINPFHLSLYSTSPGSKCYCYCDQSQHVFKRSEWQWKLVALQITSRTPSQVSSIWPLLTVHLFLNSHISPCVLIYLLSVSSRHYSRIPNFPPLPPDPFLFRPSPTTSITVKCLHTCCSSVCLWFTALHYKHALSLPQTHGGSVWRGSEPLWQLLAPGADWPEERGESSFLWPCHRLILKVRVSNGCGVYDWAYGQRPTHSGSHSKFV